MREIQMTDPHRKKHFDFFNAMSYPQFQVTSRIPMDKLNQYIRRYELHFTSAIVYWLTRTALDVAPFRWRIRGDKVVEHYTLDPSFAVPAEGTDVFSFCTVEFDMNWHLFQLRSTTEIKKRMSDPIFEDEEGKDDFLFMSSFPWVSFTGIQHPVAMPADSIPRITWGKIEDRSDGRVLPLSVQAHHALVDGRDMGRFFQTAEKYAADPMRLFPM